MSIQDDDSRHAKRAQAAARLHDICPTMTEIRQAFRAFDSRGQGKLEMSDLKCACAALMGYRPSKYEVNQIFVLTGINPGLSEDTFCEIMSKRLALCDSRDRIRAIFRAFDTRCRGFLSLEDVLRAFKEVCSSIPEESVCAAFHEVDVDGRGRIGLVQFEGLMRRKPSRRPVRSTVLPCGASY